MNQNIAAVLVSYGNRSKNGQNLGRKVVVKGSGDGIFTAEISDIKSLDNRKFFLLYGGISGVD